MVKLICLLSQAIAGCFPKESYEHEQIVAFEIKYHLHVLVFNCLTAQRWRNAEMRSAVNRNRKGLTEIQPKSNILLPQRNKEIVRNII